MEDSISSLSPVTCGNLRSCIHWYWFVKDIWAACWIKSMDQSLWGLRNVVWVTEKCKFISAISALISTSKKISRSFFSTRVFFHKLWQFTEQPEKEGDHFSFLSATSTRLQIFRPDICIWYDYFLFYTAAHACNHQAAVRWVLSTSWN